ncbi:MAG TPA: zf-HC2 domain-containing protein [Actinomycetota bacterium]|nr:zf-HC2 domain-containing protein [Actinomycetota bacterium]
MTDPRCEEIRSLAPEVALGIASGDDRAALLRHVTSCDECRAYVTRLSAVADDLLLAAPIHEAPAGFESRVLQRVETAATGAPDEVGARRGRRGWVLTVAAAVTAAAVAAGAVWIATGEDRKLAGSYRATLATANGEYFSAADLVTSDGDRAGVIFGYQGDPSWMFVVLDDVERSGDYSVSITTTAGRTVDLGRATFDDDRRGWGTDLTVDVHHIETVRLFDGADTLTATIHHD